LPFTVNSVFDVNLDGNLTDRLNTTNGITQTGNGSQPLQVAATNLQAFLAPIGRDGQVGRNSFRAGGLFITDVAVAKRWAFATRQSLGLRLEVFNLLNRDNFSIPVRFLEAPGFGRAVNTSAPARRVQVSLRYQF
jgi:hypothetical protein